FFQAEDGIRDYKVTGVQTCALPISMRRSDRACQACFAKAIARSAWMLRSWNSSMTMVLKLERSGSCCSRAVSTPSVMTSRRVLRSEERRVGKEGRGGGVSAGEK